MHQARVLLDSRRLIAPVDRRIFGGFLEHVGRAVYGGVFEPGSELADENGFRRDVISAVRRLGVTAVRYPGGNFASAYDWRDGVGPRQQRPQRREPAWEQLEPNTFGTDEFLAWCAAVGVEPILTANLGTGTPRDAAEWVGYCRQKCHGSGEDQCHGSGGARPVPESRQENEAVDTSGASGTGLPSAAPWHGADPWHGVKLWCLGNEMDGPWQVGHTTADAYAARALDAARLMREVDPDIQLLAAGSSGDFLPTYMRWDRAVLQALRGEVDFLGVHRYSGNARGDTPWFLAEGVAVDRMIEDFAALLREAQAGGAARPIHLAIDEWNTWYRAKGPEHERGNWRTGAPLLQEGYNLEDALVAGQYLASFIRHADVVKLACLAQVVNALAPIVTTPRGILKQTIYHAFALFARHARGHAAQVVVHGPRYHAGDRGDIPAIDAAATFDAEKRRWALFLTNRLVAEPVEATLSLTSDEIEAAVEAWQLLGDDPKAANTFAEPERVIPVQVDPPALAGGAGTLVLPPLSLTVVAIG